MHRRQWEAKTTARIGLEGLTGTPMAEMCPEPQLSQAHYEQGRDPLLANAAPAVEHHPHTRREAHLEQETIPLKKLVGALLLECNKSDA